MGKRTWVRILLNEYRNYRDAYQVLIIGAIVTAISMAIVIASK